LAKFARSAVMDIFSAEAPDHFQPGQRPRTFA